MEGEKGMGRKAGRVPGNVGGGRIRKAMRWVVGRRWGRGDVLRLELELSVTSRVNLRSDLRSKRRVHERNSATDDTGSKRIPIYEGFKMRSLGQDSDSAI